MLCRCGTRDSWHILSRICAQKHNSKDTQTHIYTGKPQKASCEKSDFRLTWHTAAIANTTQSIKQQWKTKTNWRMKLNAEELRLQLGKITEKNTHSSVSPGILSLSRWAFMVELCSFALLWTWYACTLPACHPPHWQRAKPNHHNAFSRTVFLSPLTKRAGAKRSARSCFGFSRSTLKLSNGIFSCLQRAWRQDNNPFPSPNTRPLLSQKACTLEYNPHHHLWLSTL